MTASQSSAGVALKACPFCGGGQIAIANDENKEWHASTWWAVCEADQCGATGPAVHDGSEEWVKEADLTPEECTALAIAAWNCRATPRAPATTGEGDVERVAMILCEADGFYWAISKGLHEGYRRLARAAIAALPISSEHDQAMKEALSLANALWNQHYREKAPNWKPFDDLVGLLTQIDNMTAGLTRKDSSGWEAGAEAMREQLMDALSKSVPVFATDLENIAAARAMIAHIAAIRALPVPQQGEAK